jgi:hypothetical protein
MDEASSAPAPHQEHTRRIVFAHTDTSLKLSTFLRDRTSFIARLVSLLGTRATSRSRFESCWSIFLVVFRVGSG